MTWSRVLLVVGTVTLVGAVLAAYIRDTLVDSDEFGDRAEAVFTISEVRDLMTDEVVHQLVEAEPELLTVQPLLETIVDGVLRSDVAADIFGAAITDLHRTVFTDAEDTVTIRMADLIVVAKTQLTVLDPELGALIPDDLTDAIISVDTRQTLVDTAQFAEDLRLLAWVLPIVTLVAFIAAIWLAVDPVRAVMEIGLAAVAAAVLVLVVEQLGRSTVTSSFSAGVDADLAGSVWDVFTDPLGSWALVVASSGAAVAAATWFGVDSIGVGARIEHLTRLTARRTSAGGRVGWGVAVAIAGLIVIIEWESVLRFALTVLGAGLIGMGIREVVVVVAPRLAEGAAATSGDAAAGRPRFVARWLPTIALVVLAGVVLVGVARSDGAGAVDESTDPGCNGSVLLCDRRFDDVVLAATHNSNAAADDGYTLGYQTVGIVPQLEDGIRGLLIDVYFGLEVEAETVVTDRAPITPEERDEMVAELGESAVLAAEATQERTAELGGRRDLFLCHAFCELGATPFVDELERIRRFLEEHPREVIVMIVQDEGPLPADVGAAFDESGLTELVYTHELGDPWPTLGEMIDANTRVFVTAENHSGEIDWYHDAFTFVQDTPFSYESVEDFDCDPNRGTADSPLFLVNHWLSPVSPTSADRANDADVLRDRIERCRSDRGRLPNMIAVDFHDRGDVIDIVRELNGI